MTHTPEEVVGWAVERGLVGPGAVAVRLDGGLLNEVYRLSDAGHTLIVKHAPAAVASAPEIPLSPARLSFEGRALTAVPGLDLPRERVRTPALLALDAEAAMLAMEDLGPRADALAWLPAASQEEAASMGAALGGWLGALHRQTFGDAALAAAFDNGDVQRTRKLVQYDAVGPLLEARPARGPAEVQRRRMAAAAASVLGELLLARGMCLVMGDLWPRSLLIEGEGIGVIDWELVHFGQPEQDLAHLVAHLWMAAHVGADGGGGRARALADALLTAWVPELAHVLDERARQALARRCAVHAGAEILVRAAGPFVQGYLYAGVPTAMVEEAVDFAVGQMSGGEGVGLFTGIAAFEALVDGAG